MFAKYIIRLDDASPMMSRKNWNRIEGLLDRYKIKPMVAIIPNNQDEKLRLDSVDEEFWAKSRRWQAKGWEIALHGYEHKYVTKAESIVPINNYSEFAGVPLEEQKKKIREGVKIFKRENLSCRLWIAPAHSFDENTIKALKSESDIQVISDGIAFNPYWENDICWIPQQLWRARKMPFGLWTICYHPDMMKEKDFLALEEFLEKHAKDIVAMNDLKVKPRKKNIVEKVFEHLYWKILKRKKEKIKKEKEKKEHSKVDVA